MDASRESGPDPVLRWAGLCLDCADADEMARFYGDLFGWEVLARDAPSDRRGGSGWVLVGAPTGGPTLSFQAEPWYRPPVWPEVDGEPTKMMHLEVAVTDVEAAVARVVATGGRVAARQPLGRDPRRLRVVFDPAGHPFCLCNDDEPSPT